MRSNILLGLKIIQFIKPGLWVLGMAMLWTTPAVCQESSGHFEVAPQIGYAGASPLFGVTGAMSYPKVDLELSFNLITGNYTTLYPLTFGLLFPLGIFHHSVPYGLIGGGMSITVPDNAIGAKTLTTGHILFGGGLKHYFNDLVGIRGEIGQILTLVKNNSSNRDELLFYQKFTLGIILAFGKTEQE